LDDVSPKSALSQDFIRCARISEKTGALNDAYFGYVHAAWAADDTKDDYWSARARKLALDVFDRLPPSEIDDSLQVMRIDLLRRSGQYEKAIEECTAITLEDPMLSKIIAFQLHKSKANDSACYTVADV
jgi:hypothetical protein